MNLSNRFGRFWIGLTLGLLNKLEYLSVPHYSQILDTVSNLEVSTELY